MSKKNRAARRQASELRAAAIELGRLRALLLQLAEALYTHARTDLAPDECLPQVRRLLRRIRRR